MELLLLIWLACGIAAGMIASNKGNSGCLWFGLGILLGPLGLMGAALTQRDPSRDREIGLMEGSLRLCPYCAEAINVEARRCRFCNSAVPPPAKRNTWDRIRGTPRR